MLIARGAMATTIFNWVRNKRLQIGEWLYWRRQAKRA